MFRQGDVLLITLAKTPKLGAEVPITGLGPVLALGEITGHHHTAVAEPTTYTPETDLDREPVRDSELTLVDFATNALAECNKLNKAIKNVEAGEPAARLYESDNKGESEERTLVVSRHTILRHDEHKPIMLAPGAYTVRIQREWFGDEARRVAD
jgi:hypothetical protein